uniref:DUF4220 domain-containing protein n=1 Tax=Panicum hallii var. hallii TaxID=1504633 RepID=A0A2T7EF43_9POAL|nr:hypothetical protein GQ55_3G309300 [Panicum hallii var. hallii]
MRKSTRGARPWSPLVGALALSSMLTGNVCRDGVMRRGAPSVRFAFSEDMQSVEPPESLIDGADYTGCSYSADRGAMWCRSLTITFTIMLLVWHLVAAMTVEAADHCAFSLLTMYLLRAAGILLPFYVVMRLIRMVQRGQQQYRLQMLEDQRRNASTMNHMHGQEEQQLVISIH